MTTKGQCSKRHLRNLSTVAIWRIWTGLISKFHPLTLKLVTLLYCHKKLTGFKPEQIWRFLLSHLKKNFCSWHQSKNQIKSKQFFKLSNMRSGCRISHESYYCIPRSTPKDVFLNNILLNGRGGAYCVWVMRRGYPFQVMVENGESCKVSILLSRIVHHRMKRFLF